MTDWDALRNVERRAAVRAVAAVVVLLLVVSLGSVWLVDSSYGPARSVQGLEYGLHLAARDDRGGSGSPLAALLFSVPALLVLATAVVAGLVAGDPRRGRAQVHTGLGAAATVALLLEVVGAGAHEDLALAGTGLVLGLVCSAAAAVVGVRTSAYDLHRNRTAPR